MIIKQTIIFISLLILLALSGACAPESPPPAPAVDMPYLSSADAISIAQEHSVNSPLNFYEKQAGLYARMGGVKGWNAQYIGSGKWTVEFRLQGEGGGLIVHRWSVFESNLTAVYVGVFSE